MKSQNLILGDGDLPINQNHREACLEKPYYEITDEEYNELIPLLLDNETDIFIDRDSGRKVTIGEIDGQCYIIPLIQLPWIGVNEDLLSDILFRYLFIYLKYY